MYLTARGNRLHSTSARLIDYCSSYMLFEVEADGFQKRRLEKKEKKSLDQAVTNCFLCRSTSME